ncbi:MAG TPA: type II toxin-antitoxin system Phd/YefM family antitoxin [Candidatus Paceibacterota bacterium]
MSITTFTAKEAKNNFGRLLDEARRFPVFVKKNGRKVAVMLSLEEYNFLEALSDAYWVKRAKEAAKSGFIGIKKSQKLLTQMLNARR